MLFYIATKSLQYQESTGIGVPGLIHLPWLLFIVTGQMQSQDGDEIYISLHICTCSKHAGRLICNTAPFVTKFQDDIKAFPLITTPPSVELYPPRMI